MTPRLLTLGQAAAYCGIGRNKFAAIRRAGRGPREFNPDDGRPLFAVTALDEWMHTRDDRPAA